MHSPPLTWMVGPINYIHGRTHHSCERGTTHLFVVLHYWIITPLTPLINSPPPFDSSSLSIKPVQLPINQKKKKNQFSSPIALILPRFWVSLFNTSKSLVNSPPPFDSAYPSNLFSCSLILIFLNLFTCSCIIYIYIYTVY